jgi:hypothetical protein
MKFLSRLFGSDVPPKLHHQLEQTEREAIIDLLLLGMYADRHLSLAEDASFAHETGCLGWEGKVSLEYFVQEATNRARTASESNAATDGMLEFVAERLTAGANTSLALELLAKVLSADGREERESAFLTKTQDTLRA